MSIIKIKEIAAVMLIGSLVGGFCPVTVFAEEIQGSDGKDIIKKIVEPENTPDFQGTAIQILVGRDGVPVVKRFSIRRHGKEFVKREVEDEGATKNSTLGLEKGFAVENKEGLKRIEDNYQIEFIKNNTIAGRPCAIYSFRPKEEGRLSREFWVDTASGLPLRIDTFSPEGRLLSIASFQAIEFHAESSQERGGEESGYQENTGGGGNSVLEMSHTPDQEIQKTFGENIRFPEYVPRGYGLRNILVQRRNNERIYQLIYSDGIVPLSIFQKKVEEGFSSPPSEGMETVSLGKDQEAYFKQKGMMKILCFTKENEKNTIIGEINKDEMMKIARSIYLSKGGAVK